MGIEINKKYLLTIISFNARTQSNEVLTYEAIVVFIDENFIEFFDKYRRKLNYNISAVSKYDDKELTNEDKEFLKNYLKGVQNG